MTSLKKATNRRVGSFFAVAALLLATITPGLVPAFASAAQLSERSVELSSSSKSNPNTDYNIKFSTESAADAVVVDFCSNSPLAGIECDHPAGLSTTSAGTSTAGFALAQTTPTGDDAVVLEGDLDGDITLTITGVTNPSAVGALYVRIVTYDTNAHALTYDADALVEADVVDQGSAAVSITDTIGVSAAVNETLTFCVSGVAITNPNCDADDGAQLTPPTVKLGETATGALDSTKVSEGSVYSQISTNAISGAIVSLKSGNECGGLKLGIADADDCGIAAAGSTPVASGSAVFGLKLPTVDAGLKLGVNSDGSSAFYNAGDLKLDYTSGGASGVTSAFGNPVYNTGGVPVNNQKAQITFGASIANDTAAGLYSNDYSLIATGKF